MFDYPRRLDVGGAGERREQLHLAVDREDADAILAAKRRGDLPDLGTDVRHYLRDGCGIRPRRPRVAAEIEDECQIDRD